MHGWWVEGTYDDGYRLNEAELDDRSPYDENANVYHSIVNDRAVEEHGPLAVWSIVPAGDGWDPTTGEVIIRARRFDIDWRLARKTLVLPRPIYYRRMSKVLHGPGAEMGEQATAHVFGYQWLDGDGRNRQHTIELR